MAVKFFLVLCASALFVQTISARCYGNGYGNSAAINAANLGAEIAAANNFGYGSCNGNGLFGAEILGAEIAAANNFGYGYTAAPATYANQAVASSSGGCLGVSSSSPIAPNGVSLVSENAIDGALEVVGSLPVLAAVAFEGTVPSAGAAGTSYSCGSGNVGISSESLAAAGIGAGRAAGNQFARAGLSGYNAGLSGYNAGLSGYNAGLSGYNAGLSGYNAGLSGARLAGSNCGCSAY